VRTALSELLLLSEDLLDMIVHGSRFIDSATVPSLAAADPNLSFGQTDNDR
jgi:hypothetical protein